MESRESFAFRTPFLMGAVGLSALTSGAIVSMSLVTIPVVLTSPTNASLLACWRELLIRGFKLGPTFAAVATMSHVLNAYLNRNDVSVRTKYSLAAAASTIAIVPFTLLLLSSTNAELLRREAAARATNVAVEASSVELIKKWGRLNAIRALLPAAGAVLACFAL